MLNPGGAMAYANNIPVTPGASYPVTVGAGGAGVGAAGGDSWLISPATLLAEGGGGGTLDGGDGGNCVIAPSLAASAACGSGGRGGDQSWESGRGDIAGGGGGAGGYAGTRKSLLILHPRLLQRHITLPHNALLVHHKHDTMALGVLLTSLS
jgi:hypothetical protein